MKLGFVSAVFPELVLENVFGFARQEGFPAVGIRCWKALPDNKGFTSGTHLDVINFTKLKAESLLTRCNVQGVCISSLEAYPIILGSDHIKLLIAIKRFKKTITAANRLGLKYVTVFIGRDQNRSIDGNWSEFLRILRRLVKHAAQMDVNICLKTSPCVYGCDYCPAGENLLISPFLWGRVFNDISSPNLGLDFDPRSLLAYGIAPHSILLEYRRRIFNVHFTTSLADPASPNESSGFDPSSQLNPPSILAHDRTNWPDALKALRDIRYGGPVCIQIDGQDMLLPLEKRMNALRGARAMLAPYLPIPESPSPAYQSAIRVA